MLYDCRLLMRPIVIQILQKYWGLCIFLTYEHIRFFHNDYQIYVFLNVEQSCYENNNCTRILTYLFIWLCFWVIKVSYTE